MKEQILVKRYAQGLVNSAKNDEEFAALLDQLEDFQKALMTHKSLADVLTSPVLPPQKRLEVASLVLSKMETHPKTRRFLMLLMENHRLPLLPQVLENLPALWNEKKGISTFEVTSAVPLSGSQRKKLEETLIRMEKRPVSLVFHTDSSLIGGLSVRKGNIVYDVSLEGGLQRLKQKIAEG